MVIKFCPRCNRPIMMEEHTTDYVHTCDSGSDVLDKEDELLIGDYEDDNGNVVSADLIKHTKNAVPNKLFGTRAGNEGAKSYEYSERGNKKATHREEQHKEYISFS